LASTATRSTSVPPGLRGGTRGRAAAALFPGFAKRGRFAADLSTTPGRLRLLLAVLVLLSLAWGALAAFTVNHYASAAASVVAVREPLSLDAQQIYRRLSDANDTAATAFLAGGLEPAAARQRYLADIRAAGTGVEDATAQGGAALGAVSKDLGTLAAELPVYTGEVETARADNRLGLPLGAAYLREASALMRGTLLPAAGGMYATENASLSATSAQATGLPLVTVTVIAGLGIGYVLYRASRWLSRRTHRVFNYGLLLAAAAGIISLLWLAAAYGVGRSDLLNARARGSAPVEALARADIAALQAHAYESLTLIDNTGDDSYQQEYLHQQQALGPGPGTLLTAAQTTAAGSGAAGMATAAVSHAQAWYRAHTKVRALDDSSDHAAAVASVLGSGPGDAGTQFGLLSADLAAGIATGQAAFDSSAQAGRDAYTALEPGVIATALVMVIGCAWGLNRRLAEYR
jgi:hypothetical protein